MTPMIKIYVHWITWVLTNWRWWKYLPGPFGSSMHRVDDRVKEIAGVWMLPKELPITLNGSLTATRPNSFHKSQSNSDSSVRSVEEWNVSCRCLSPKRVGAKHRVEKLPNRGEVKKTSPSLSQPKPRRKQRNFSATTAEHIKGNFLPKRIDNSLELLLLARC